MARKIDLENGITLVQGFRGDGEDNEPYVYLGFADTEKPVFEVELTSEQSNILGEFLRQEAEFSQEPAGQKDGNE